MPTMFADQPADRMRREWVAQQHKNKVTRVRGTVSTGWSHGQVHQFGSLGRNGKKAMNDIVRQKEIDRENERLVGRFLDMEARRPRGSVAAPARVKQRVGPTSLNVSNRKREEDRIWKENQRMMKRIQKSKPSICVNKLAQGHRNQQKIMGLRMVSKLSESGPPKRPRDPWDMPVSTHHHSISTKQPHEDSLDEFTREHSMKEDLKRQARDFVPDEDGHIDFQAEDYLREDEEDIRMRREQERLKREIEDLGRQMKGGIYPAQRMAAPKGYGTGMKPNWHQDQYPLGTPPRGLRAPQVRPPVNQESHSKSYEPESPLEMPTRFEQRMSSIYGLEKISNLPKVVSPEKKQRVPLPRVLSPEYEPRTQGSYPERSSPRKKPNRLNTPKPLPQPFKQRVAKVELRPPEGLPGMFPGDQSSPSHHQFNQFDDLQNDYESDDDYFQDNSYSQEYHGTEPPPADISDEFLASLNARFANEDILEHELRN